VLGAWYAAEVGVILAKGAAGSSPVDAQSWGIVLDGCRGISTTEEIVIPPRSGEMMTATLDGMPMTVMVASGRRFTSVTEVARERLAVGGLGRIGWRGVGDGNAGMHSNVGESAAESACAGGTGECPGHALALRIILHVWQ